MKILIVGAGAVGMVYGRNLALGGAEVTFFVREKYRADLEWTSKTGFLFYLWNQANGGSPKQVRWTGFQVSSSLDEVRGSKWDFVIIATSSTGLKSEWLEPFLKALNPESLLVTLQPGMNDVDYLVERFPRERLIEGTIPIVSYFAPLKTETFKEKGIGLWLPPGAKVLLTHTSSHSDTVALQLEKLIGAFNLGGLKTEKSNLGKRKDLVPATILALFVAALRKSDWSFQKLKSGPHLQTACHAMNEIIPVLAKKEGVKVSSFLLKLILRPVFLKGIIVATRFIIPFDFETYLELHFTKVGDQMKQNVRDMIWVAGKSNVPVPALLELSL